MYQNYVGNQLKKRSKTKITKKAIKKELKPLLDFCKLIGFKSATIVYPK